MVQQRILVVRVEREKCFGSMFGIENGLWEKSIFFSSSFHSYIGKSTIQQNSKRSFVDQLQLLAELGAREAGEFPEFVGIAGDKERGVAVLQPERKTDRGGALRADVVGERAGALAALAPEDVAETGLALALRPRVHAVAERARAAAGRRDRPDLVLRVFQHPREHLEAGAAEMFRDVLHHDRVAQIRLVGAVFRDRILVGDQRKLLRHRLAVGEFLEHAAHHRLDRVEHVVLGDKAHLDVELIELAGRDGRRARPRRGNTARSGNSGRSPPPSVSCLNCCGACGSA